MKVIIIDSDAVARENISSKIKAFWPSEMEITMLDSIQDCYNALQREQEDYLEATDGTGKTKASVKTKDIISVHISPGRKREIESSWIKRINQDKL